MKETDVEIVLQRAGVMYPNKSPGIIPDRGPRFIARDFKEYIKIYEMKHVMTSPYYPRSNGKKERWYRTLKAECIRPKMPFTIEETRRVVTNLWLIIITTDFTRRLVMWHQ